MATSSPSKVLPLPSRLGLQIHRSGFGMSVLDGQSSSNSEPHLVGKITGAERQLSRSPDLNVRSHDAVSLNVFAVFQAQNPIETTPLPLPFLSLIFPPSAPALKWTIARDLIPTVHRERNIGKTLFFGSSGHGTPF